MNEGKNTVLLWNQFHYLIATPPVYFWVSGGGLFPSTLQIKILYTFLTSTMCDFCYQKITQK
jgi:hypothetical protein